VRRGQPPQRSQGLFFPAGHCEGIRLGGYLLQGGYGWNSKVLGPACESVLGLEVVTADGEQIYCDPENHPDLYWAARGSGTGFFGVVTSFKLRIYRRPAVLGTCLYMYSIELVDEVYTWGREMSPEIDDRVELQILATCAYPAAGIDHPAITVASPVFAEPEEEAAKALAALGTCPVVGRAMINIPYAPTNLAGWYTAVMSNYPKGPGAARRRYGGSWSAAVHRADRDIDGSTARHYRPDHDRGPSGRTCSHGPTSSPA